jgi:FixJ family two-component response regulator
MRLRLHGPHTPDWFHPRSPTVLNAAIAGARLVFGGMDREEGMKLAGFARRAGWKVLLLRTGEEILRECTFGSETILFLNSTLEDMTATEILTRFHRQGLSPVAIVVVPPLAVMAAVDAIKAGASDVLEQPLGEKSFSRSLEYAQTILLNQNLG